MFYDDARWEYKFQSCRDSRSRTGSIHGNKRLMTLHAVLGSLVVLLLLVAVTTSCGFPGAVLGGIFGCMWLVMGVGGESSRIPSTIGGGPVIPSVDLWPLASKKDRRAFIANLFYNQPRFPLISARLVGISCIRIVVTDGIPRQSDGPLCGKPEGLIQPSGRQVWILLGEAHTTKISAQGRQAGDLDILQLIRRIHIGFPQNTIDLYYEFSYMHPPAVVEPDRLTTEMIKAVMVPYGKDMNVAEYTSRFSYPCYTLTTAAKEALNPPCWEFGKENNVRYTQIDPRRGVLSTEESRGRPERVGELLGILGEATAVRADDPHMFQQIAAEVGRELWGTQEGKEDVLRNMPIARKILTRVVRPTLVETAVMVYAALLSVSQQLDKLAAVRRQVDRLPQEVVSLLEERVSARRTRRRQEYLAIILNRYTSGLPSFQLAQECIETGKPHPAMDTWYQVFDDLFNIEVSPIVDLYVVARGLRCWRTEENSWPQTFIICIEGIGHVFGQEEMLQRLGGRTVYSIGPTREKFYPNIMLAETGVVA